MSWIVENYIKRSLLIKAEMEKSQQVVEAFVSELWAPEYLPVFQTESIEDVYDDLLTIEIAIKRLHDTGVLNSRQVEILKSMADGLNLSQVSSKLNLHRETVASNFVRSCKLISDSLGEHFTTDGYTKYIADKYRLDSEQEEKLRKYLESKNYTKYWRDNDKS